MRDELSRLLVLKNLVLVFAFTSLASDKNIPTDCRPSVATAFDQFLDVLGDGLLRVPLVRLESGQLDLSVPLPDRRTGFASPSRVARPVNRPVVRLHRRTLEHQHSSVTLDDGQHIVLVIRGLQFHVALKKSLLLLALLLKGYGRHNLSNPLVVELEWAVFVLPLAHEDMVRNLLIRLLRFLDGLADILLKCAFRIPVVSALRQLEVRKLDMLLLITEELLILLRLRREEVAVEFRSSSVADLELDVRRPFALVHERPHLAGLEPNDVPVLLLESNDDCDLPEPCIRLVKVVLGVDDGGLRVLPERRLAVELRVALNSQGRSDMGASLDLKVFPDRRTVLNREVATVSLTSLVLPLHDGHVTPHTGIRNRVHIAELPAFVAVVLVGELVLEVNEDTTAVLIHRTAFLVLLLPSRRKEVNRAVWIHHDATVRVAVLRELLDYEGVLELVGEEYAAPLVWDEITSRELVVESCRNSLWALVALWFADIALLADASILLLNEVVVPLGIQRISVGRHKPSRVALEERCIHQESAVLLPLDRDINRNFLDDATRICHVNGELLNLRDTRLAVIFENNRRCADLKVLPIADFPTLKN